jgi:DNA-binding response OmpR family regulator
MSKHPVLLVEDDLALREALTETLRLENYDVLVAEDGTAALKILQDSAVSAVVTDYQMRPMDGYELLRRIRESYSQTPVLMMTAHGTIQHAVQSMLEGAADYLVKPFSAQLLTEKLEKIVPSFSSDKNLVAEDPVTVDILNLARKVACTDSTVLLCGEAAQARKFSPNLSINNRSVWPGLSLRLTAQQFRKICSRRSCSDMRKAPSLTLIRAKPANSNRPKAEHCYSMKSVKCILAFRRSYFACFRRKKSTVSVVNRVSSWTFGCWPQRTATSAGRY